MSDIYKMMSIISFRSSQVRAFAHDTLRAFSFFAPDFNMATTSVFILLLAVLAVSAHDEFTNEDGSISGYSHPDEEAQDVYINIKASTTGFVGFGIAPNGVMQGADLFIGGCYENRTSYFGDYFGNNHNAERDPDNFQNWELDSCENNGTQTVIQFRRKFDTGDKEYDLVIGTGKIKIIWSMGATDNVEGGHGTRRGGAELTLRNSHSGCWNLVASLTVIALGVFGSLLV